MGVRVIFRQSLNKVEVDFWPRMSEVRTRWSIRIMGLIDVGVDLDDVTQGVTTISGCVINGFINVGMFQVSRCFVNYGVSQLMMCVITDTDGVLSLSGRIKWYGMVTHCISWKSKNKKQKTKKTG